MESSGTAWRLETSGSRFSFSFSSWLMSWFVVDQPVVHELLVVLATRVVFAEHTLIVVHGSSEIHETFKAPESGHSMNMNDAWQRQQD
jgi:hypothetical protein